MFQAEKVCRVALALAALMMGQPGTAADRLVDSTALEFGAGAKVQALRLSAQSDWSRRWFESNGTHLTGYWDANLGYWRGSAHQDRPGQHQNIAVIGLSPVFRFERVDKKGWYAEGAIGIALLSELYDNDSNRLSTRFQFSDHLGVGYVFNNRWDLGVKIQHYSNGGFKKPNSGVNFFVIKANYRY